MQSNQLLSERLRILRVNRGLSQPQLAEKLQLSAIFISNLERGKSNPSMTTLQKYVAFFEVDLSWLLSNEPTDLDLQLNNGNTSNIVNRFDLRVNSNISVNSESIDLSVALYFLMRYTGYDDFDKLGKIFDIAPKRVKALFREPTLANKEERASIIDKIKGLCESTSLDMLLDITCGSALWSTFLLRDILKRNEETAAEHIQEQMTSEGLISSEFYALPYQTRLPGVVANYYAANKRLNDSWRVVYFDQSAAMLMSQSKVLADDWVDRTLSMILKENGLAKDLILFAYDRELWDNLHQTSKKMLKQLEEKYERIVTVCGNEQLWWYEN